MKILVTGHKGFIGQNMVKSLLTDGHEVVGFEWGDPFITDWSFDQCIHLGAISSTTYDNVFQLLEQNYHFTKWLLGECHNRRIPIQIASSASVYGIDNDTFREIDKPAPRNYYAWSKFMVEEYCLDKKWNNHIQLLRYFNVFGPHEDHKGDQASPIHKFTKQAKETGTIKVFEGSENYKRDFIHVDTLIDYHKKLFRVKPPKPEIFNVGTGKEVSFMEVAEAIAQEYDAKIEMIKMPDNLKNSYQKFTKANMTKTNTYTLLDWNK